MHNTLQASYNFTVNSGLQITNLNPPSATVGTAYSFQFTASGGVGPYTWSVNQLPAGLTLSSGGLLSGTPTAATATPLPIVVTVTDSAP